MAQERGQLAAVDPVQSAWLAYPARRTYSARLIRLARLARLAHPIRPAHSVHRLSVSGPGRRTMGLPIPASTRLSRGRVPGRTVNP
jgi:hypothetical protein